MANPMCPTATPRRAFTTAGAAALAPPVLGPGGCPFEVTTPRWKEEKPCSKHPPIPEAKPTVIFIIGGPGTDRTVHCAHIAATKGFHLVHLNIIDLMEEERSRPGSDVAPIIEEHMTKRTLVPCELVVDVMYKAITRTDNWKHGRFLIDGFPRTVHQAEGFYKLMKKKIIVKSCLYLDCREATAKARLLKQAIAEGASEADALPIIQGRLDRFRETVLPVQRFFQYEGLLERIDASRDMEKVWVDVLQYFVCEEHEGEAAPSSPNKVMWKLRDKQVEEIFPTGHAHTSISYVQGPYARAFSSYAILAKHRDKHTRNMHSPVENYTEPMTLAQEIGWHQDTDGSDLGAKGTPRGMTTPRSFYPRNTCAMTRHLENMYSTNAQHIIRRW